MAKPDFPEAHDAPRDAQTIISALQSLRSTQASALSGRSDVDHASRVLQTAMRAGWIAANPVPEKAGDKEMGAALDGGATPAGHDDPAVSIRLRGHGSGPGRDPMSAGGRQP
jgi:hypothetical protein